MDQDAIWDHFQNEGVVSFDSARPRLEYLARRLRPGERTLNIGVGAGELEEMALRRGVEIWSLDPSERTIERLRQRLKLGDRAQAGRSEDPPFPSDHFDAIVMTEVLEHLDRETLEATIRQVRRMLRPGGRFIGTVPAREQLEMSQVVCPHCHHQFHRWGHQASFDLAAMRELLAADFEIERVDERFFNDWDSASLLRRAGGLAKRFLSWRGLGPYGTARNIYFSVRKPAGTSK